MSSRPTRLDPRKFPPGHAVFKNHNLHAVIIYKDGFYNDRGDPLKKEASWLRANKYTLTKEMHGFLKTQKVAPKVKTCHSCGERELAIASKFCHVCGSEQAITIPDQEDALMRTLALLDPSDPFAALTPAPDTKRVTAAELMPSASQILADARKDPSFPRAASGVPGEASTPTAPQATITPGRTIGYGGQRSAVPGA